MDVSGFVRHLTSMPWYEGQIVHVGDVPPRAATTGILEFPLKSELRSSLESIGIEALYSHQAEALHLLRRGRNVIVSTSTASGKSLCYHIPVLEALWEDHSNRALYLFPTKALAQDQSRLLERLIPTGKRIRHGLFHGDTPVQERAAIKRTSQVLITNPDMLHLGILPNHRNWYQMLRNLRYVVIDEAHVYCGVFGSHVANVIRRLRRLCDRLGSSPQFILCSATVANPSEHSQKLVGLPFEVVEESGAPYGGKDFLFWNPPMIDLVKGRRRSTNREAALIFAELMRRRIRSLAFVRSRRMAEVLYVYVRDRLRELAPSLVQKIAPYRANYLPEDRRKTERDFVEGHLLGLTTTNAMELGINIGDLDATVLTGYPGSIASTWQQAGRSGRSGERSLSVLVALDNPLDQYLMNHPDAFFGKSMENARISPANPYVLKPHLVCAAYEAPITMSDIDYFGPELLLSAAELVDEQLLMTKGGRWHLRPEVSYPAQGVNIRSTSGHSYTLVEHDSGVILETVEEMSAFLQLYPGAVYLHGGEPYLISDLDLESRTAYGSITEAPYFTQVLDYTETRVLDLFRERSVATTAVYLGRVNVTTTIVGFKRIAHLSEEVLGEEYLSLPPRDFDTIAMWFDLPSDTLEYIQSNGLDLAGGLHAVEHAAIGVLPLFAFCDRNDIGGISTPLHPDTGKPQVFIHDGHPGGVGLAEHGFDVVEKLWRATLSVISGCPCEAGCPGCVQSPKCGSNNKPLDKSVAEVILRDLTDSSAN